MSTTRHLLPSPWSSLVLFAVWVVLDGTWSLGQMLMGALLALLIPWWTAPLHVDAPTLRSPLVALRLGATVLRDIVVSNLDVARRILGPEAAIRPGFVWVPLDIADPHGIVMLAGIVTMTPGTLSAELSDDRRHLLVHALDLGDPKALVESIKSRYETPLIAIFEGE
jgi:multicomponent K+:H+ antiporter subunit E